MGSRVVLLRDVRGWIFTRVRTGARGEVTATHRFLGRATVRFDSGRVETVPLAWLAADPRDRWWL